MHLDSLAAQTLLAAARRLSTEAELRCRALLDHSASERELRAALQGEIARSGLTESGFVVAAGLLAHEPAGVSRAALAGAAGLSPLRTDDALARLEMSQLVCRQRDTRDRRLVWLRLTPAGVERITHALSRYVAAADRATASLNVTDLAAALSISRQLRRGAARLHREAFRTLSLAAVS